MRGVCLFLVWFPWQSPGNVFFALFSESLGNGEWAKIMMLGGWLWKYLYFEQMEYFRKIPLIRRVYYNFSIFHNKSSLLLNLLISFRNFKCRSKVWWWITFLLKSVYLNNKFQKGFFYCLILLVICVANYILKHC